MIAFDRSVEVGRGEARPSRGARDGTGSHQHSTEVARRPGSAALGGGAPRARRAGDIAERDASTARSSHEPAHSHSLT